VRAVELLAAIGWKTIPRIHLGPLAISPHGIGIAVGYALGGQLLARRAERSFGLEREHVWNMLMYAVIGVVVGSRLFYVVGHISDYVPNNLLDIVMVQKGGIVLYGGIFGGIAAAYPYARKHRLPFLKTLDAAAPCFPLGLIFGRLGDLMIGDHLGGPTSFFLGWRYQGGIGCDPLNDCLPDRVLPIGTVVHQTALYDLMIVLVLFPLVLWLSKTKRFDGWLISVTAIMYAVGRFLTDFARTEDANGQAPPGFAGLHGTQWVSVVLIIFATGLLIRRSRRVEEPEAGEPVVVSDDEPPS
jgi:phosphatidylglycerol---prolipoprotein diacylglyceryl transferase